MITTTIFFLVTVVVGTATATNIRVMLSDWVGDYQNPNISAGHGLDPQSLYITTYMFLAVKLFNDRRTDLYPALLPIKNCAKNIQVVAWCDDTGSGLWTSADVCDYQTEIDYIIGTASMRGVQDASTVATALTPHVPLISHRSTWSDLGNHDEHPYFARTQISDSDYVQKVADLILALGYTSVACMYVTYDTGPSFKEVLYRAMNARDITIVAIGYTMGDPVSIDAALARVKATDLNVIIYVGYLQELISITSDLAAKYDLLTNSHLWMLTNLDDFPTAANSLENGNFTRLLHGAIAVTDAIDNRTLWESFLQHVNEFDDQADSITQRLPPQGGHNDTSCRNDYRNYSVISSQYIANSSAYATDTWARTIDAVMAVGIAACQSDMGTTMPNTDTLYAQVLASNFIGFSGVVAFDNTSGNRIPTTTAFHLLNWQPVTGGGAMQAQVAGMFSLTAANWTVLSTLTFKSGLSGLTGLPPQWREPDVNNNYLGNSLKALGYAETAIIETLCFLSLCWLYIERKHRFLLAQQVHFLVVVVLGCAVAGTSILALTVDDDPQDMMGVNVNVACRWGPFVFVLGMVISLIALLVRAYRLKTIFYGRALKAEGVVTVNMGLAVIVVAMIIQLSLLFAWVFSLPLTWVRQVDVVDMHEQVVSWHGSCSAGDNGGIGWASFFIVQYGILLLLTSRNVNQLKHVSEEYQDVKQVSMTMDALLQMAVLVIAACIVVYEQSVVGRYIVMTTFVFLTTTVMVLFVIGSKFRVVMLGSGLTAAPKRRSKNHIHQSGVVTGQETGTDNTIATDKLVEIETAIRIPTVLTKFEVFVQAWQGGLDMLNFILDVLAWSDALQQGTTEWRRDAAQGIVNLYVADEAIMRIEVQATLRDNVIKAMDGLGEAQAPDGTIFDELLKEVLKILQLGAWAAFVAEGGMFAIQQEKSKRSHGTSERIPGSHGGGGSPGNVHSGSMLSRFSKKLRKAATSKESGQDKSTSNVSGGGGGGSKAASSTKESLDMSESRASVKSVKLVEDPPVAAYMADNTSSSGDTWKAQYDAETDSTLWLNVLTGEKLTDREYRKLVVEAGGG